MLQTLFYIPEKVFGLPLFGGGLLLALWGLVSLVILGRLVYKQGFNSDTLGYIPLLALVAAAIYFLMPQLNEPGLGLPIRGYGVMLLIGVVSGVSLAVHRAEKRGIDPELIFSLAFWMFLAGIGGARLFYVIEYWNKQFALVDLNGQMDWPATIKAVLNVAKGGLVVYGALVGAGVAGIIFLRKHRLPVLKVSDAIAPSLALGLAVGRIGCFLNGCCFGGVSDLPWAMSFPQHSPPYERQLERGQLYVHGLTVKETKRGVVIERVKPDSAAEHAGLKAGDRITQILSQTTGQSPFELFPREETPTPGNPTARFDSSSGAAQLALLQIAGAGTEVIVRTDGATSEAHWKITPTDEIPLRSLPVQPTQLYSAIDAGLLCLFLLAYDPFRRRNGEILALLLTLHAISRFLLESIRTDEPKVYLWGISISQLISLLMLVGVALFWLSIWRSPRLAGPKIVPRPAAS